jgi:hypothetical protein
METQNKSIWTQFWDMHSGGVSKEDFECIYIEAPKDEAEIIFYNRFGHNPNRVTCTCCGPDYSIEEGEVDQITASHRNCKHDGKKYIEEPATRYATGTYTPLENYMKPGGSVLFIHKEDIKDSERVGEVPEQGYVWKD